MTAAEKFDSSPGAPIVDFALGYARRGWHVFPCWPGDKSPCVGNDRGTTGKPIPKTGGLYKATTDEKQIRTWWLRWPNAMIGVRTGSTSGVWAIDPDAPKRETDADGRATWARLMAQHGVVHTHAHQTPGGGQHLLFKWDANRPVTNKEGQLKRSGINVRGEGGYIIAPPSVNADGKCYAMVDPIDHFNFAEAPDWLYDLVLTPSISEQAQAKAERPRAARRDKRPYAEAALRAEADAVASCTDGNRNNQLNTSAFKLGTLVGAGELSEGEVIGALYDAAVACGLVADSGHRAVMATINSGLSEGVRNPRDIPPLEEDVSSRFGKNHRQDNGPKNEDAEQSRTDQNVIHATPYAWKNPQQIPRRDWLYGYLLVRKFVTATISPGGVGKSSLIAAEALAQVSGKDLLGVTPKEQLRVWLWNLEDPQEETERKIQAAALHYGLTEDDIGDRFFSDSGRDQPLIVAVETKKGATIVRPVIDSMTAEIIARKIDIVIVDPFVSSFQGVAENDNPAMDMIVKEWGKVANKGNCAIHLVDHTRKMGGADSEVTVESSRGAKAKTDACRIVRAINRMTKEEAERAGVENHRLYFRTFNDKANLQPPAEKSDWFKLESVDLCNGPLGSPGDSVGVVTQWQWPDPLAGVTGADFDKVAAVIRGGRWRENVQASAWVGRAVAEALELNVENRADKNKILALLSVWRAAGSLVVVEGEDEKRMVRKFVEVREDS